MLTINWKSTRWHATYRAWHYSGIKKRHIILSFSNLFIIFAIT